MAEFRGQVSGKAWSYKSALGKPAWHRFTVTELNDKQCHWKNEFSKDAKTWTVFGEGRMTKE